jgi:hypothetical protein
MPEFKDKVEFEDVVCKAATDLAILVTIDGKDFWIPQKQVDDDSEIWKRNDEGKLVISEWIALKKGLI